MTTQVRAAKEDDNLLDWLRIMSNDRFRHLPVVDEEGKVVSMMSQGDFVLHMAGAFFPCEGNDEGLIGQQAIRSC